MSNFARFIWTFIVPAIITVPIGYYIFVKMFELCNHPVEFIGFVLVIVCLLMVSAVYICFGIALETMCNGIDKDKAHREKIQSLEKKEIDAILKWYEERGFDKYE